MKNNGKWLILIVVLNILLISGRVISLKRNDLRYFQVLARYIPYQYNINAGTSSIILNQPEQAISHYQCALNLFPSQKSVKQRLISILYKMGIRSVKDNELKLAQKYFAHLLSLDPENPAGCLFVCSQIFRTNPKRASQQLDKIRVEEKWSTAISLTKALLMKKRGEEPVDFDLDAIAPGDIFQGCYYRIIGDIQWINGDPDSAMMFYLKGLNEDPGNSRILVRLGAYQYLLQDNQDEACRYWLQGRSENKDIACDFIKNLCPNENNASIQDAASQIQHEQELLMDLFLQFDSVLCDWLQEFRHAM